MTTRYFSYIVQVIPSWCISEGQTSRHVCYSYGGESQRRKVEALAVNRGELLRLIGLLFCTDWADPIALERPTKLFHSPALFTSVLKYFSTLQ